MRQQLPNLTGSLRQRQLHQHIFQISILIMPIQPR